MFIADFHIHSKYSRATSRDCTPEFLDLWARRKGISLLGTGDFTHPEWRNLLAEQMEPAPEEGLYLLKKDRIRKDFIENSSPPRFLVTGEISSIYKKNGRVRKVHNVILLPGLEAAEELSRKLEAIGNIHSDGRPILGLDSRDLLEITLETCPDAVFIPAHIWTPHFSLFGAFSGFDSIEECFEDMTPYIHALETGLSSDPPMNWRLSALDSYLLVSNSDAHSPSKLGREANLFECGLSYPEIASVLRGEKDGLAGTVEFFPEEGKYHFDGHRNCHACLKPSEAEQHGNVCPVCGKKLTIGVLHRVEQLADRPEGFLPPNRKPFENLIPLPEIIAASLGISSSSKKATACYEKLLQEIGPEFFILREAPLELVERIAGACVAEGLRRMRTGKVQLAPGYDGEYGKIQLLDSAEMERLSGQLTLFGSEPQREELPSRPDTTFVPKQPQKEKALSAIPKDLIESLSSQQREAALSPHRTSAVIAGPGTGKTRTLVARILYLTGRMGVSPSEITAVTFTKKAAAEMLSRLQNQPGGKASFRSLQIGTFHSICLQALRSAGNHFGISGEPDSAAAIREICRQLGCRRSVRSVLGQISKWKNGIDMPEDELLLEISRRYQAWLEEHGLLDYDDILRKGLELFETAQKGKGRLFRPFTHLLVDEFQDMNPVQYQLVRIWAENGKDLFAIGDPNQAIYGFRGSDPRCFERLEEDFPETQTFFLTQNYRSVPAVLKCASAVLPEPEKLKALRMEKDKVRILTAEDDFSEALFVAKEINRMTGGIGMLEADSLRENPLAFSDIAVLYRTNRQSELLEKCLSIEGIPYVVTGRETYLENPVPRAASGFFRHLLSPYDDYARDVFLELGPKDAAIREPELTQKYLPRLKKEKPFRLLEEWANDCGLSGDPAITRMIHSAVFYSSMEDFLEVQTLGAEGDILRGAQKKYSPNCVTLTTLHGAKGLEFPAVFLCGAKKGTVPLEIPGIDTDPQEERRLFYVGLTRACKELIVLFSGKESPFLAEFPESEILRGTAQERKPQADSVQLRFF